MLRLSFVICLLSLNCFAQKQFFIANLSSNIDLRLVVEKLELGSWRGKTIISVYRKGNSKPFQVIRQRDTYLSVNANGEPKLGRIEDKNKGIWSTVYLEDLNFDGSEDLAIADGTNGGYGGISYRVYTYNASKRKFIYNPSLTRLAQRPYIGMFEPNRKADTISVFWKSTCCEHFREEYRLLNGRPKLVGKVSEYYDYLQTGYTLTETRKLINGRWRKWKKREKINREN